MWLYCWIYICLRNIRIPKPAGQGAAVNCANTKVIIQNCTLFTKCISEVNNTQVDNAHDIDAVMPIYNLIECNDVSSNTSGRLWQYYRNESDLDNNQNIIDFSVNNNK